MTTFIIATRNPADQKIWIISDSDEADSTPAEFDSREQAEKTADRLHITAAWGYEILEVPPI